MKLVIDVPEKTIAHIRSNYGHGYKGLLDEDREIIVNEIYKARMYVEFGAYINGYLKALEDKEWIPISERLPEVNQSVLATTNWGEVTIAERLNFGQDCWFIHEGQTNAHTEDIVAWQPLPEPYKGGDV